LLVRVRDLGEFGLIERLAGRLQGRMQGTPALIQGIGDDAAVWRPTPGRVSVLTTDVMIEGVHFTAPTTPWRDLGWKSLAVNVSDLAAMGAQPRVALVTLALTGEEDVVEIDALYDGMADLAVKYGVQIIGGDTVRGPQVQIGFALTGEAEDDGGLAHVLRRDAAKPGDLVVVSGQPGDAAGGLELLLRGKAAMYPSLVAAHRRPVPRVREAIWLFEQGVRCATDSSDGLVREVALLCAASGIGAWLDASRLPISPELHAASPERATELALYGGEDYELVVAVEEQRFPALQAAWQARFATPLTAVGAFRGVAHAGQGVELRGYDGPVGEFQHFAPSPS
jgi:thiamine-monophosphate kinase